MLMIFKFASWLHQHGPDSPAWLGKPGFTDFFPTSNRGIITPDG
jgi:hypothetical protein